MHKSGIFNVTNTPNSGVRLMLVSLGCVLAFAPPNAMGATVTASGCTVTGTDPSINTLFEPCNGATQIKNFQTTIRCDSGQMLNTCLQSTTTGTTYYITHCSCDTESRKTQTISSEECGDIEITYLKCVTGDFGGSECTSVRDCGINSTNEIKQGYLKTTTHSCLLGYCRALTSYECADGYGGTPTCTYNSNLKVYSCSGCEKTCNSDDECNNSDENKTSGNVFITIGYKCQPKSDANYSICTKYTKNCECIQGTYGTPTPSDDTTIQCNGTCTACPIDPITGIAGTTDDKGKESIKDCYLPKTDGDVTYTNAKGTFIYTDNCHHPVPNNNQ